VYMRKTYCLILYSVAAASVWAQTPYAPGRWGENYTYTTPAQADWADHLEYSRSTAVPAERPAGERVSVARLRHKPPSKAVNLFVKGVKLASAGDCQSSAAAFEQAVSMDPAFSEAHANLGVQYSTMGLFEKAAAELRRAVELDPPTGMHHSNLAYVLIRLRQDRQAEREAQTAVTLDPDNTTAHYLLGFLLAQRPQTFDRAVRHLDYATRALPEAHLLLARLYQLRGENSLAHAEMEQYLNSGLAVDLPGGGHN